MQAFRYEVPDPQTARLILNLLADYDKFQLDNNVKPDYCNVGGLEWQIDLGDGLEWMDWWNIDGDDIKRALTLEEEQFEGKDPE